MAVTVEKFRVLLLIDRATFHAERYAAELKRQGCRVLTASLEQGALLGFGLKRRGPFAALHYLLAVPQVRQLIKRFRPNVISAHYASGYGFVAALSAGKTPYTLNLWGSDILVVPQKSVLHRAKTAYALRKASSVFSDSDYMLKAAQKLAPIRKSTVIPWGVERQYLSYHKKDYNFHRPLRIIVPRAHEPVYNNSFIIEALAPLISQTQIEITFPAFGRFFPEFRHQCGKFSSSAIRFYEKMPRDEFLRFMAEHDVYLSAATSDSSPVTLIEAMALGLAPVAADIEGVREWLTLEAGFRFRLNDVSSLRAVIQKLTTSTDQFGSMRRENYERVRKDAVFEENIAQQIRIMKELAGK